ncbi:zinc finger RNA-binding protein-like isoform X1 [Culicoides brevitarsis]|uniref:zinc finger RNA-binding protein-like isoform X1 n=1 Tax=Culicoides brevitarsis TaxID=469753 RepID=UPI00307B401F
MSGHNYYGFTHGGTQYGAPTGTYAPQPFPGQPPYPPAPAPQQYAGTTSAPAATYDYGYARPPQTYDTSKTYYQQAGTPGYAAPAQPYDTASATSAKAAVTYAQPVRPPQVNQKSYATNTPGYQTQAGANPAANAANKPQGGADGTATYSNYDAALYSAASLYAAQQQAGAKPPNNGGNAARGGWKNFKPGVGAKAGKFFPKAAPKPQQIHYCEVCKISCAGPQTYREHLEGQKHKKREALQKQTETTKEQPTSRTVNCLHCELCDVTCTGNDAYAAHVRGSKHQKVVKLHTKLGKPIPSSEPQVIGKKGGEGEGGESDTIEDVQPVGNDYIEELKDEEGKVISFNCKLCDCKFNDPNAKEMHMKGRRHRLQYKKKVQPDLVVEVKPNMRNRKPDKRHAREDFWNRRRTGMEEEGETGTGGGAPPPFWGSRYDEEYEYWMQRGGFIGRGPAGPPGMFFNIMRERRPETADDRHVVAHHAEIYPKEEELKNIQRIVSHTERALKLVSDTMAGIKQDLKVGNAVPSPTKPKTEEQKQEDNSEQTTTTDGATTNAEDKNDQNATENGGNKEANQMISFHKDADAVGSVRMLKGVMRVGLLAKGLLLRGDKDVQLVVLCAEKPTTTLLRRVAQELPIQLKTITEEFKYTVTLAVTESAVNVTDGIVTVKVSLTSPLLREQEANATAESTATPQNEQTKCSETDLLPREPCLQALAALRHAKWFQARATGLHSCVMIMRIIRDLCQRVPIWTPFNQWAMELFVEKVIASAGMPLSPGDSLRRVMEAFASGTLIYGPGILDPCEKEPQCAIRDLSKQQREDITHSAQQYLRFIAFRQIHKVLGMDQLPPPKFPQARQWRFNRKRRRSGTETGDSETDGKMVKKDDAAVATANNGAVAGTVTVAMDTDTK